MNTWNFVSSSRHDYAGMSTQRSLSFLEDEVFLKHERGKETDCTNAAMATFAGFQCLSKNVVSEEFIRREILYVFV